MDRLIVNIAELHFINAPYRYLSLGDDCLDCVDEIIDRICLMPESYPLVYRDVRRAVIWGMVRYLRDGALRVANTPYSLIYFRKFSGFSEILANQGEVSG